MSPPLATRARWLAVVGLYVGFTLAYAAPLLPVLGSALPNDIGDPALNVWLLWWNAHAIPLTTTWWNAPIFYPEKGAMALSETLLNLWPLSTPMQWAGASAVLTHNVMYLLSFPTAALAAHALAWRLTRRHDAALIAGLAYGFAPYRAAQISHLQVLWSCWMPLGLLCLHRFLEDRRRRDLVLFGVCWVMNGLATGYYLFYFSILTGLWLLWFARSARDWKAIAIAIGLASLVLAPELIGYQHYQSALGITRTNEEIQSLGADLSALWTTSSYLLPRYWTLDDGPEGELYPGATIFLLVLLGRLVLARQVRTSPRSRVQTWLFGLAAALALVTFHAWWIGGWAFQVAGLSVSLTHPARTGFLAVCVATIALCWDVRLVQAWRDRSPFLFYSLAAVLMFVFALGPRGQYYGTTFLSSAPYAWLMQLPGGHAFRVPARFGMLFSLCLATAAALAFKRLTPRGAHAILAAAICAAVAMEGYVIRMHVPAVPVDLGLGGLERGAVMLELPVVDEVLTHISATSVMLRATRVGYTLVNGTSGYDPPHYRILKEGLVDLDESVLRALQRFGPLFVFVHEDTARGETYLDWVGQLPDAHRVLKVPEGVLFQLPARPPPPQKALRQLRIASIHADLDAAHVNALVDNNLGTKWQTVRHQTAGDELRISLEAPATISRVEMDLGSAADDYPRKLRISVVGDDSKPTVVWEGRAYGPAMLAVLADHPRMPLSFDLTPQIRGRELIFTLLDGQPDLAWSIAELKVLGE